MATTRRTATITPDKLPRDLLLQQVAMVLGDFRCPMPLDDLAECALLSLADVRLGLAQGRRCGFIQSPHRGYYSAPALLAA